MSKQQEEPKGDVHHRSTNPYKNDNNQGEETMEHDKVIERVMTLMPQAQGKSTGEILALAKSEGGGFGEGGQGLFFLLFILLLLGRNGGGLFGVGAAAAAGLTVGDLQNITTQIISLSNNQNEGFANMADRLCNVNNNIMQSKFDMTTHLAALGTQMQKCCCQIERAIDGVSREIDQSTCTISNLINVSTNAALKLGLSQATQIDYKYC